MGGEEQAQGNAKKGSKNICSIWEARKFFSVFKYIYCILQTVCLLTEEIHWPAEITEEGIENETMQVKSGLCAFALACIDGITNFLPNCVFWSREVK